MTSRLLTILFWILAVPTGALATIVVLLTIGGRKLSSMTPLWLSFAAGVVVLAMLVWAFRLAGDGGRPGVACLLTVASWLIFAITMTVNGLIHQKTWN